MSDDINPREQFWMVAVEGGTDGRPDIDSSEVAYFTTYDNALEHAKAEIERFGCRSFIYKCKPVAYVGRRPYVEDMRGS
jgi:hypothetical protein